MQDRETKQWREKAWKDVAVGDYVRVTSATEDRAFPADICALCSANKNGILYVETKVGRPTSKHPIDRLVWPQGPLPRPGFSQFCMDNSH